MEADLWVIIEADFFVINDVFTLVNAALLLESLLAAVLGGKVLVGSWFLTEQNGVGSSSKKRK